MSIDTHVSHGSGQIFVFSIVDVPASFGVNVLLGQAKIDDMNDVWVVFWKPSNQTVFRFDVSINQVFPEDKMIDFRLI